MKKSIKSIKGKQKTIIRVILILEILLVAILGIINLTTKKEKYSKLTQEERQAMEYDEVTNDDAKIEGTDYVRFSAFFLRDLDNDGYAEKYNGTCREMGKTDTLYMDLNVLTNGYLKDGKITINGENFYLSTAIPQDREIAENAISPNIKEIKLKNISNGTQKLLSGEINHSIINNINDFSKISKITLTGTHVSDENIETPITKEVNLTVDWHGEVEALFTDTHKRINVDDIINQNKDTFSIQYEVELAEIKNQLPLSKAYLETEIPKFNNYNPLFVELKSENYTYDEETRKLIVVKEGTLDEEGNITSEAYIYKNRNYDKVINTKILATYPMEAYETLGTESTEIRITSLGYYEGYNNPNNEFDNPKRSPTVYKTNIIDIDKVTGDIIKLEATIGQYVEKEYVVSKEKPLNIYNGRVNNEEDLYTVRWNILRGREELNKKIILTEKIENEIAESDEFVFNNGQRISMENITTNVGISFQEIWRSIPMDGYIQVFNQETDELIHEFTYEELEYYNSDNPYYYDLPVKHIKVIISQTNYRSSLIINNIKKLDDEYIVNNFTKEEFREIAIIKTKLTGYADDIYINTVENSAKYIGKVSIAILDRNITRSLSTQETSNDTLTISTIVNDYYQEEKWKNGIFLVKFPQEVLNIEIDEIRISRNEVNILSYETYEKNGNSFLKIYTENEEPSEYYEINIRYRITPDPRIPTGTREIELFASNEFWEEYRWHNSDIYDINNNGELNERVNYSQIGISLVSPNSLLTNQIAKNYDDKESITIAPNVANISKEQNTATIDLNLKNNYNNGISEISILGKIPKEGNKYVLNGNDLGSEFDTNITENGIQIPIGLEDYAKVYYSEKEEVNKELEDTRNQWVENPEDWSRVKSYLIILDNYTMPKDASLTLSYDVKIPEISNYNNITYSDYAVFFSLETDEGRYQTQTEPSKLGLMVARQYSMNLTKYQKDTEILVQGATYKVIEEETEKTKTQMTNTEGNLTINELLVDRVYKLKEIKTNEKYELNNDEIKFKVIENNQGNLKAILLQGNPKNTIQVQGDKINLEVEDVIKIKLKIKKYEKDTNIGISNVKYSLKGKGFSNSGKVLTTNTDGEIITQGLYQNEKYILEEIKAEGYYIDETPISFKITNTNGEINVEELEGNIKNYTIISENDMPTIEIELENNKKSTYNLQIRKIEVGKDNKVLEGAKFRLFKNNSEIGTYITDENGIINIENLYLYENNNQENGEYILKEITAPQGYVLAPTYKFKVQKNQNEELDLVQDYEENKTNYKYTSENNTITINIEDHPSLIITKKDGDTGEPLPNTKFVIYDITSGSEEIAYDSRNLIVGEKELIDGKEYYVVTTDENGEIKKDLQSGKYVLTEVKSSNNQYMLADDYYFTIGKEEDLIKKYSLKEVDYDNISITNGSLKDVNILQTPDNGFLKIKSITVSTSPATLIINEEEIEIPESTQMLIKYDENLNFEWKTLNTNIIANNKALITIEKSTGNIYYIDNKTLVKNDKYGNEIERKTFDNKLIGIVALQDEGYLLFEELYSEYSANIQKYNAQDEYIKDTTVYFGNSIYSPEILYVFKDNSFIMSQRIYMNNDFTFANEIIRKKTDKNYYSGVVILKWNSELEEEKGFYSYITDDMHICDLKETKDGGYIAVGNQQANTINLSDEITFNRSLNLYSENGYRAHDDTWILKVSKDNVPEKFVDIPLSIYERINENKYTSTMPLNTASVIEDEEGNYILSGYYRINNAYYDYIVLDKNLENPYYLGIANIQRNFQFYNAIEQKLFKDSNNRIISSIESNNQIKIDAFEKNGSNNNKIKTKNINIIGKQNNNSSAQVKGYDVVKTNDGGYLVSGFATYLQPIQIDDNGTYVDKGYIIKYNRNDEIEWIKQRPNYVYRIFSNEDNTYYSLEGYNETIRLIKLNQNGEEISNTIIKNGYISDTYKGNGGDILVSENNIVLKINRELIILNKNEEILKTVTLNSDITYSKIQNNKIIVHNNEGLTWVNFEGQIEKNIPDTIDLITTTKDGGYITGKKTTTNNENRADLIQFTKYKGSRVEWTKTIYGNFNYGELYEKQNGEIIFAGCGNYSINREDTIGPNPEGYRVFVIVLSKEGDYKYGKYINSYGKEYDYYMDVEELKNGDIVVVEKSKNNKIVTDEKESEEFNNITEAVVVTRLEISKLINNEIRIDNYKRKYNVYTKVEPYENEKGGTISGEEETPYETVIINEDSQKEIKITPNEGYEIRRLTINGKEIEFESEADGTYTLPLFENMTEDKEVIVSFIQSSNKITINKVDSETRERLEGVKFNIKEIPDEIEEVNQEEVIGQLTTDGTYGFTNNSGTFISSNQNIQNSTCLSYVKIDLTNYLNEYNLVVNATVSSEQNYDFGYLTIKNSLLNPSYSDSVGRFCYISGTSTPAKDYTTTLNGGQTYYLYMGYRKDVSANSGTDTFTINSIEVKSTSKIYEKEVVTDTYGQIIETIPYGKYEITEVEAKPGYIMPSEPTVIDFLEGEDKQHEFTIENSKGTNLIINKTDSETNEPLEGVEFEVKEYGITNLYSGEFNTKPENKIEYNGTYNQMNNYHFPPNEEGKYVSNNQGINGSIAKGMVYSSNLVQIPNFTNGSYILEIDAEISSEEGHDFGYINITEGSPISGTDYSQNCIAKISGEQPSKKYYKLVNLETYAPPQFINFAYIKDDNGIDGGEDTFKINSINVYKTEETEGFKLKDGKIQSTNKGKANSQDLSHIVLDFTNQQYEGRTSTIEIDYTISSEKDKDIATIKYATPGVAYTNNYGATTVLTTSGEESNTIRFNVGTAPYYIYFNYAKNGENDEGDDCFTINDIRVIQNEEEIFEKTVTTDSNGQIKTRLNTFGYNNKYTLIEKPLEGYETIEPIQFTLENGEIETQNIENTKLRNIIVHHYLKDEEGNYTQTKVAEDEKYEGKLGEEYRTKPHIDLEKYELEKDNEGNYIVPVNAIGNFAQKTQEINYYYEAKDIPLIVHHYIRGTSEKVPLSDGTKARDEEYTGKENEEYRTNALTKEQLSPQYELVETPENAEGTYQYPGVDVTYFYDEVERDVVIKKVDEDGETPIEGVKFSIEINGEEKEYITDENGEFSLHLKYGVYELEETETPNGYIPLEDPIEIGITKEIEEGQIIKITNAKEKGNVIVHHYIKGTTTKVPSKIFDETGNWNDVVEDEEKRGILGNPFATKPSENISNIYKHVSNTKPTSGQYKRETQEIIYYYDLNLPNILVDIKVNKIWRDEDTSLRPEQIKFKLYKADQNGKAITKDIEENEIAPIDEKTMSSQSTSVTFNNIHKYDEENNLIKYAIIEEMIGEKGKQYKYEVGNMTEVEETNKLPQQYGYKVDITNYQVIKELEITKTGTNSITSLSDTIRYNITYKAKIDKSYNGIVNIKITDNLPYKIDTTKAYNLKGGEYNESTKKIEWSGIYNKETQKIRWSNGEEETVGNQQQDDKMWIDTSSSTEYDSLNLNKNINLTYKDIPVNIENFENNVKGRVEIETGGYIEKEDNKETTVNFKVNITARKIWKGDSNKLEGRPNSTTITLYVIETDNEGNETIEKALDENGEEITAEIKAQDNWEYTFNNLPKYNNRSEKIKYTAREEVPEGYYNSNIEETEGGIILITNNKYGSITITKVDKNTGERLGGAIFKIEKLTEENQIDETFAKQEKETSNEETNKGDVTFDNLKYGKYRITEIKAPEGYNLSILPIEIEITEENPDKQELFTNRSKELLPAAGGSMKEFIQVITIYTEVGALAIMLGILINKKKKAMK